MLNPKVLDRYLEAIADNMEDTAPDYEPVFTDVDQHYGNSLALFTNTIDDLILQLPILIKLKVHIPMLLYSMDTVPVPLDAETYTGAKQEYTQILPKTEYIALTESNYVPLMQAQISLCAKIGYMYYCEYAHLLKKRTEHTCMSAIYYDQSSEIKADKCKTIVTFDTLQESKILDAGDFLILSNLQKPWTIVCKDVNRTFDLEYSTYRTLNRSELCQCSLMAGNYQLSQAASNCGGMPEAKDGFFTTYYAFNRIVLDVLMEKFDVQVDEVDITSYDLPAINFVSPSEEAQESHILKEQDIMIYTHLEKVLIHMIDEQDAQIVKSHNDYVIQYLKYAETWQSMSVICSYAAFLSDILLMVTFIVFFLKYCKTMQAMLTAFITMNMSDIKLTPLVEHFPPLFVINLPKEDQIVEDLEDIEGMQTTIQAISFIVCVIVAIIILYQIFKRCHYTCSIVKYCFPFFPILRILRGTHRMDLFVEVTNLTKGNTIWVHLTLTGYYPTLVRLS